jgi:hypothetical protein
MSESDSLAVQDISHGYVSLLGVCHYVNMDMPDGKMPRNGVAECICEDRSFDTLNGDSHYLGREKWTGISQSTETIVDDALRVLSNGGGLSVPGALNKFSAFAQRVIPRKLVFRMIARMSRA